MTLDDHKDIIGVFYCGWAQGAFPLTWFKFEYADHSYSREMELSASMWEYLSEELDPAMWAKLQTALKTPGTWVY